MHAGHYEKGRRNGDGWMLMPDGSTYEGNFLKDKLSGPGTYSYLNSDKYEGEWLKGKKHGLGTYTYADGGQLVAQWKKGRLDGPCEWRRNTYGRMEGNFVKGVPDGNATFHFPGMAMSQTGKYSTDAAIVEEEGRPTNPYWRGLQWKSDGDTFGQKFEEGKPAIVVRERDTMPGLEAKLSIQDQKNIVDAWHRHVRTRGKNVHL
ncbi:hypothetical protein CBR_g39184 [Chara braunii]|uniref:MORN repeat-containing protein 5 n=1 Tax=Chara braunii TaxID=69332 RepID=A0A388LR47_CHABU|nr:hypothetical protein CBR_g39184 [Chara braunii]|eukprot:GBG84808.1 hypothetical protein CBR_g39184 [Chara braunii]